MAQAVEKARVVLICYSHPYYLSPNCRMEAEYTFQKKKPIIPVRMEKYNPEDWLGIMIGAKLYFDFHSEERKQRSIDGLKKEIKTMLSGGQQSGGLINGANGPIAKTTASTLGAAPPPRPLSERRGSKSRSMSSLSGTGTEARQWTVTQVSNWLEDNGLAGYANRFGEYNEALIMEMKELLLSCPDFLCTTLQKEMRMPLIDMLRFTKALRVLT